MYIDSVSNAIYYSTLMFNFTTKCASLVCFKPYMYLVNYCVHVSKYISDLCTCSILLSVLLYMYSNIHVHTTAMYTGWVGYIDIGCIKKLMCIN